MARLPSPGGDNGNWGDILNDFLSQIHNGDGTLKANSVSAAALAPGAVDTASLQDGQITEVKLDNAVQTKLNTPTTIPDGSITKAKLVTSVQSSLDKADSALQTAPVASVNTRTGAISLTKADVGLTNVDNTADSAKPVSGPQQAALGIPIYTLAARPAATGSQANIWVSDVQGGQLQKDTAAGAWTPLAPGVSQASFGLVASASFTSNQPASPTSSTTDVDTGVSVTFNAVAGATYAVRLKTSYANTVVSKVTQVSICDSANARLDTTGPIVPVANSGFPAFLEALVTPGFGTFTYKARVATGSGGTATMIGATTGPILMSVYRVAG